MEVDMDIRDMLERNKQQLSELKADMDEIKNVQIITKFIIETD